MSSEREPTDYEIERLSQLDRVSCLLNVGTKRIKVAPRHCLRWSWISREGKLGLVFIDPKFLYGVWRVRESLVNDLSAIGYKEEANDIVSKYQKGGD